MDTVTYMAQNGKTFFTGFWPDKVKETGFSRSRGIRNKQQDKDNTLYGEADETDYVGESPE